MGGGVLERQPRFDGARVLVTGATGFLGGHVVRRLLARGAQVTGQGRSVEGLRALEQAHGAGGSFGAVAAELSDPGDVKELVDAALPELTVHCAAKSAPFGPRAQFERANVAGTEQLLSALGSGGPSRGLVHVSTPSLYCAGRPLREVTEQAELPRRSINAYAWSKGVAERRVRASGLPSVILRPRAIFGPGDTALFPRLLEALGERGLPVIGDGENLADLTYVDNVCVVIEGALGQLRAGSGPAIGGTYNVTNGEPVRLWDVVRTVAGRLDLPGPGSRFPRRLPRRLARAAAGAMELAHVLLRRGGEPRLTRYSVDALALEATLDISAARRDLGYVPEVPMAEGIEAFLRSLV